MKILLLGSLVSQEAMEQLNKQGKAQSSVAPVNYELMLVKGLQENGAQVEAFSVPAMAAWPRNYLWMRARQEQLSCGVFVRWIPFINAYVLKDWTVRWQTAKLLKKWLKENRDVKEKVVLMYSIYPPYSIPAVRLCRRYGCHISSVIADLPEYLYKWDNHKGLKGLYGRYLNGQLMHVQSACDSYVLFTEKMAHRMGVEHKPYLVSEGLSDVTLYEEIKSTDKYERKTILYAGNLSGLYGIRALVDGFMKTTGEYELHLYGSGDDVQYICACAQQDPRIRYFGRVARTEILQALTQAQLIVINKPTADDYSNYSFSSKILECMASGTPVLTTRVGGMPPEYYNYVYFIEDETPAGIAAALQTALERPSQELAQFGAAARNFVMNEKNYRYMTERIKRFLSECI